MTDQKAEAIHIEPSEEVPDFGLSNFTPMRNFIRKGILLGSHVLERYHKYRNLLRWYTVQMVHIFKNVYYQSYSKIQFTSLAKFY